MPIHELLDYFNREQVRQYGERVALRDALSMEGDQVVADYAGLKLGTLFQPMVALASDQQGGHEALLSVTGRVGRLTPSSLFMLASSAEDIIYLDRLCRTLHALNFLLQPSVGGLLSLNVHPRHLASVRREHGLAFERILRECGLEPSRVMLEIQQGWRDGDEDLARAVDSYRDCGYRIALDRVTAPPATDFWGARPPDLIKLHPDLNDHGARRRIQDGAAALGVPATLQLGLTVDQARHGGFSHVQSRALFAPATQLAGPTWRRARFP